MNNIISLIGWATIEFLEVPPGTKYNMFSVFKVFYISSSRIQVGIKKKNRIPNQSYFYIRKFTVYFFSFDIKVNIVLCYYFGQWILDPTNFWKPEPDSNIFRKPVPDRPHFKNLILIRPKHPDPVTPCWWCFILPFPFPLFYFVLLKFVVRFGRRIHPGVSNLICLEPDCFNKTKN